LAVGKNLSVQTAESRFSITQEKNAGIAAMSATYGTGSGVWKMAENPMCHQKTDNEKQKRRMASNHLPLLLLPFEEISEYAVTGQTSLICIFRSQSSILRFGQKTAMHYSFQKHVGKKIPFYPGHN